MTPPRMPRPIAAPAPGPWARAVAGTAVSATAASIPAAATPRPSCLARVITEGLGSDWGSGRVCICLVDMTLSGLADPNAVVRRRPELSRRQIGAPEPDCHIAESAANLTHSLSSGLVQAPASRLAHVPDTFASSSGGNRCRVVDD